MWNPSSFGRFKLIRPIGRGGFGDVYLADDTELKHQVALKLIRLSLADPEQVEAEQRGQAIQKRLHARVPEIAAVYDSGESDGFFFIAMEYVSGSDLSQELAQGPLSILRSVDIAVQLCKILESIDEAAVELGGRSVVHGDIKPENIRLQEQDLVRLLDFGSAKSVSRSRQFTRNVFGSLSYLSPERLTEETADSQSDLWALSVVLYQMISGHLPFGAATDEAVRERILGGRPPRSLAVSCPAPLERILWKALSHERKGRYPDAASLRADLEAFRDGRPIAAPSLVSESTRRTLPAREGGEQRPAHGPFETHAAEMLPDGDDLTLGPVGVTGTRKTTADRRRGNEPTTAAATSSPTPLRKAPPQRARAQAASAAKPPQSWGHWVIRAVGLVIILWVLGFTSFIKLLVWATPGNHPSPGPFGCIWGLLLLVGGGLLFAEKPKS